MKKALALALCLVFAGMLAVDDTFAAEFTQAVREAANSLFQTVSGLVEGISPAPTADTNTFKVSLAYPDGQTGLALLTPGNTTERKVAVRNQSSGKSAYFRIAFAVQADVREHLTLNFNNDSSLYTWYELPNEITIGSRHYDLFIGTYQKELPAGTTSEAALFGVKLDDITSQEMNAFSEDFLQIQVLAICADDFVGSDYTTAEAALDQALPIPDDFNPFE